MKNIEKIAAGLISFPKKGLTVSPHFGGRFLPKYCPCWEELDFSVFSYVSGFCGWEDLGGDRWWGSDPLGHGGYTPM